MDVLNNLFKPAYRNVTSFLEVIDVITGTREVVKSFDYLIEAPEWNHDGNRVVFNSLGRIYELNILTGDISDINTDFASNCNNDHVLSPCQSQIAFSHNTHEDGLSRIYTMSLSAGLPTLVTPVGPSYLHSWSIDGKTLAYCAERNGEYNIYVIPSGGGIEKQLTRQFGHNDGPEYSPCGRYIYFNSTCSGLMQIWRMRIDGSGKQQVTDGMGNHWFPHISPDGKMLACIVYDPHSVPPHEHPANKDVQLLLMPVDGGEAVLLAELFGGQGTINVNS